MGYRARSRYNQGGGVLAFFEQVSRFVALSVVAWVLVSLLFIFFNVNGKLTDSLELHIVRGIFSNGKLFGTTLLLVAVSGIFGALISLPAAFVLLLTRRYLDYHIGRSSRRGNFLKVYFLKYLPVTVLVVSHVLALVLNLMSAPQVSRAALPEGSELSRLITKGHFLLDSLTHQRLAQSLGKSKDDFSVPMVSVKKGPSQRIHFIFLPADLIDSQEFAEETAKQTKWRQMPFVIQRSSFREQIEGLFSNVSDPAAQLVRDTVRLSAFSGASAVLNRGQVILSLSPQLSFGSKLTGYGSSSLTTFNQDLVQQERQRRILLSQIHLFGVLRIFGGLANFGDHLGWHFLIADDMARLREVTRIQAALDNDLLGIVVIQLSGLENSFRNIFPPFEPHGWSLQQSSFEKRLVIQHLVRELSNYTENVERTAFGHWIVLPYADERRLKPQSSAIVSSDSALNLFDRMSLGDQFGAVAEDLALQLNRIAVGPSVQELVQPSDLKQPESLRSAQSSAPKITQIQRMQCAESEVDFSSSGFQFQQSETRERGFGQLLNAISVMSETDLAFLSKSASNLVGRDLGLGLLCRQPGTDSGSVYLLKYKGGHSGANAAAGFLPGSSVVMGIWDKKQVSNDKSNRSKAVTPAESTENVQVNLERDVLNEFLVLKRHSPSASLSQNEKPEWVLLDTSESKSFFAQFELDTLSAIERSARARIR
ncbi:MAG: hypothetical protein RIR26_2897 [Pseudomonadota bacterium]